MTGARPVSLRRAGATVAALTAAGRALGAGSVADAFFVAFRAAGFLRGLFGGRGAGAAFIAMFARRLAATGPERARTFAGEVLCFAAAAIAVLVTLVEQAAPRLVAALAPGFGGGPGEDAERMELAVCRSPGGRARVYACAPVMLKST